MKRYNIVGVIKSTFNLEFVLNCSKEDTGYLDSTNVFKIVMEEFSKSKVLQLTQDVRLSLKAHGNKEAILQGSSEGEIILTLDTEVVADSAPKASASVQEKIEKLLGGKIFFRKLMVKQTECPSCGFISPKFEFKEPGED